MPRTKTKLTSDVLEVIFNKFDGGEKTAKELAEWYEVPQLNNYFTARNHYNKGKAIHKKIVSQRVFNEWAKKYGKNGTPKWREGPQEKTKQNGSETERRVKFKIEITVWEYK